METKLKWIRKTSGLYRLDYTSDIVCLVSWNVMRRDIIVRKNKKEKNLHQLLKPSQNQYKYKGAVSLDNERKTVYGDNLEMVKRMITERAKRMMKKRLEEYQTALAKEIVYA